MKNKLILSMVATALLFITGCSKEAMVENLEANDSNTANARVMLDCNHNGIDDTVDIATGASSDLNLNGIPDECEIPTDGKESHTKDN